MLRRPFEEWDIKFGKTSDEPVPGEKKLTSGKPTMTHAAGVTQKGENLLSYDRVSSLRMAVRVLARVIGIARKRSFKGGHVEALLQKR